MTTDKLKHQPEVTLCLRRANVAVGICLALLISQLARPPNCRRSASPAPLGASSLWGPVYVYLGTLSCFLALSSRTSSVGAQFIARVVELAAPYLPTFAFSPVSLTSLISSSKMLPPSLPLSPSLISPFDTVTNLQRKLHAPDTWRRSTGAWRASLCTQLWVSG